MARERYVLIGDVRDSRGIRDREAFRARLTDACEAVNRDHERELAAACTVLKGVDEIGAVLLSIASAYDIMRTLLEAIAPEVMRFVLVRGEVDVGLDSGDVALMDGQAFHAAAAAMGDLKRRKLALRLRAGDSVLDAAIEAEVNLLAIVRDVRSERQNEVIGVYERTGGQAEAARELGVTQQAVSSVLRRSWYKQTERIEQDLPRQFEEYARRLAEREDER